MKRQWTQEQRAILASQIHKWKPWTRSTGPKSPSGKAKVARNPYKGAKRVQLRAAVRVLKYAMAAQGEFLDSLDL